MRAASRALTSTEVVLIERMEGPGHRALEIGHRHVEEHAVAFETETAGMGVLAEEHVGGKKGMQPIARDGRAVLDGTLEDALHHADTVTLLPSGADGSTPAPAP